MCIKILGDHNRCRGLYGTNFEVVVNIWNQVKNTSVITCNRKTRENKNVEACSTLFSFISTCNVLESNLLLRSVLCTCVSFNVEFYLPNTFCEQCKVLKAVINIGYNFYTRTLEGARKF